MSRTYALLVALSTALASLFAPQHESAGRGPKALVYCPASDVSGCTAVVNALAGAFPGGVDRGYDGGNGTVDLAKVDLMQYSVLVVPSLADRDAAKPYALLRDPVVAGRLKETFIGRVAFWSGTPDLGQANRAEKDALIRNLAAWATSNRAMLFRRGMVVLQDLSEDVARRYDWVPAIARVSVTADAAVRVYGSVSTPTDVGKAILDDGGTPLHFENMAAFGLRVATGTAASLDATGEDGAGAALVTVAPEVSRAPRFAAGVVSTNGATTTGPSVTTDKDDYAPGTIVTITGSGWGANEVVHLNLVESPTADGPHDWDVTADGSGNFTDQSFSPGPQHLGVTFTLTATGSSGSTAQTTFSDSNPQTLTVGSPAPASINAGGSTTYAVTVAVGGNSNLCTVTFSISPSTPLPTGATASFTNNPATTTGTNISSTLTISTTAATPPGSYPFTVQGTNSGSGCQGPGNLTGGQTLVVQGAANSPPVLAPIGAKSTPELQALTFTISASDADAGQALTYAATGLPTGASFDATTRTFSWTPAEAQGPGSYPVTFTVADNGAPIRADTEIVTITVTEVNAAPVLAAIADQNASEGTPFSVTAAATDADIPANAIAYSLLNAPSGMTINGTSGLITWTPDETQGGNVYNLQVVATDNGAPAMADTTDVKVTVAEVNVAPVLTGVPASATIPELAAYTFDANASDADLPAQALTFSLVGAPAGAAIDASTGVFTWTPTEAQGPGVYTFKVQVTDGVTPAEQQVVLTVTEVNTAPVLAPIGDQTVDELTALTFTASATDADLPAQALTYALVGAPAGASIDASTGAFSWTPTEAQGPGSYPFKVTVTDNGSPIQADTEQITVTVNEVNAPPVWTTIGNKSVDEETLLEFTVSATDSDLPANTLTYSVVGSLPAGATFDATTRKFSWTPTEAQGPGSYPVTLRVSDGTANVDESFTITVNEVNQAPVLAPIGDKTTDEEVALTFTASATDPDLPPNTLTFSLVGAPAGASINASTGAFSWTPSEAQGPGTYTFKVKVDDNGSPDLSDEEQITVTVNEVNVAPVIAPIPDQTVDEETLLSVKVNVSDHDLPPNTVTLALQGEPSGMTLNPADSTISWTPTEADGPGTYTFQVIATDNGTPSLSSQITVKVTVNEVNKPPVLAAIGNKTVDEETALTFTASATDPDLPPNTLTFSLVGAPAGASINASTGAFSWTPSEAQGPGTYTFKVKVTDNGSPALSDDEDITVTVNEVNKAPTLDPITNGSVNEGSTFTTTAVAQDPDLPANTLTFSIVSGPSGASIDAATGVLTWTPADDDPTGTPSDQYTITVRVTDNGTPAMSDEESFVVTVNNVAPTLVTATVDPLLTPIPVGSPVKVNATFTDPGTDSYTLKVTWDTGMLPESFANYTSGTIVSKTNLPAGVYTITMQVVDDDGGASAAQTQTSYVVIYDPSAGFVTGGGWIDSPTGACLLSTCTANTTGKATFGFVAKYQKGQSTPSGNTEFQFHAGNLNFKATAYQWLVVAGTKAQYKGEGTINGSGRYGFLVTAIDGDSKNTGQDQFRIKIWDYATSTTVYDNKMGSPEDSSDATALGGGSINIQAK